MGILQPQNQTKKYEHLFADIDQGHIKVPKFQREFVWTKDATARLIDSIIKGFPIGTFILWQTREELRHYREIGNAKPPETPKGETVVYVLDGQQRITSLYAVRKGLVINKNGENVDYRDISIELESDIDSSDPVVLLEPPSDKPHISVYDLLNGTLKQLASKYPDYLDKIDTYKSRLTGYDFSTILISDYPIDEACEVFTRINTGGTELTLFEIMVAKTYDQGADFDLAQKYENLVNNGGSGKDLEDAGYDTIPASTILQCMAAHLCRKISRADILRLEKEPFIRSWEPVKEGIFTAVDFLRTSLRIPVSTLLPYNILLVPFTYFFLRNSLNPPNAQQLNHLVQYFYWASLSNRFSSSVESKMALDLLRMEDILDNKEPNYRGEELHLDLNAIRSRWFSTGDAFCKAILCLYAYFEPKSFDNDALVKLDNSWLKVAASKNFHHFFPKAFLKRQGYDDWQANLIANITLVDDHLNKRSIRDDPPSRYMTRFQSSNAKLQDTMKSHLIDDLQGFGVLSDDYDTFLNMRAQRILDEIILRLTP